MRKAERGGTTGMTGKPDRTRLATLVGLAVTLGGCSSHDDGQWQVCTDAQGRRLPDIACQQGSHYGGYYGSHAGWVFISRSSSAPAVGQMVTSPIMTGPARPTRAKVYAAPAEGITRGGFGHFGGWGGGDSGAGS